MAILEWGAVNVCWAGTLRNGQSEFTNAGGIDLQCRISVDWCRSNGWSTSRVVQGRVVCRVMDDDKAAEVVKTETETGGEKREREGKTAAA